MDYKMFEDYPDVVTINDLVKMLNIGRNSAYKLIKEKKIKSIQIGKVHRIPKIYIIDYLENAC
ncbi:MAG: helix-turn-helix domain-containing protein [Eubacteriales bacterium]|nr:helix-turn-helix domain-containing protein [Eubacteriales bacterium]